MNCIDEPHIFCTGTYHVPNMAQSWCMKYSIDVDEMVLSILAAFKIACSSSKLDLVSEFVINSESTEVESQ